jgi:serine/threonine protein kinase
MHFKGPFPRQFGHYELLEELGRGITGIVYKCRFHLADRIQAIKFPTDGRSERALREAKVLAYLNEPGIIRIYDVGVVHDQAYIGREYVDGCDFATHLRTRHPSLASAAALIASVARTVNMINDCGIRHGNLALENVLIPNHGHPKLIGFGNARGLGRPGVRASESDIQALGKLLVAAAKLTGQVLPEFLEAITMKCEAAGSDWGYRSASEVADDLDRFLCC